MRVTLEPTSAFHTLPNGVKCRIWNATNEQGAKALFLVAGVACAKGVDPAAFEPKLGELVSARFRIDRVLEVDATPEDK